MTFSIASIVAQYKFQLLATAILTYIIPICVYRRFFSPLAKIPGPLLASVTKLYQLAYNGRYYLQIERMHEKYGPVVRITPDEVHLSDPSNYDKIYHIGSKYSKPAIFYNALCVPASTFGTLPNDIHRVKRGALNPMFSRKMVLELENVVQDKAEKVCKLMQAGIENCAPVDLHHAFRAVSVDVISDFAFNKCYNFLDEEDLGAYFFRMARGVGPALYAFQQFPAIQAMALKIPPWLAPYLSEPLGKILAMKQECFNQIEDVKQRMEAGKLAERQTVFSTLLSAEEKPAGYQVPSSYDLKDEAYAVLLAAADTTGNAMTVAAFHVMNNPVIYQRLQQELGKVFPDPSARLPFVELEKLPYLTGVIKEGLRLSFGVIGRLPRVVPEPGITFDGHFVPGGMSVSMSSWIMHRNPQVFVEPMKFDPGRWLDPEDYRRLDHHMVPFGRGSRQCLGMPLAYSEMYITLGTFFRRFSGLEVFKTTLEDMDYDDFFSSYNVEGKNWLKAVGGRKEVF